jgi:hypothetical protein
VLLLAGTAGSVQLQFQSFVAVGAPVGAVPRSQFQFHVHGWPLLDAVGAFVSPLIETWTLTFFASVEDATASPAFALALLLWLTGASLPGLATRTDTFTFVGDCWVAVAVVSVAAAVPAAAAGCVGAFEPAAQLVPHWSSDWSRAAELSTDAEFPSPAACGRTTGELGASPAFAVAVFACVTAP